MGPFTELEFENVGWIQMADSRYIRRVDFLECGQSLGPTKMEGIFLPPASAFLKTFLWNCRIRDLFHVIVIFGRVRKIAKSDRRMILKLGP